MPDAEIDGYLIGNSMKRVMSPCPGGYPILKDIAVYNLISRAGIDEGTGEQLPDAV